MSSFPSSVPPFYQMYAKYLSIVSYLFPEGKYSSMFRYLLIGKVCLHFLCIYSGKYSTIWSNLYLSKVFIHFIISILWGKVLLYFPIFAPGCARSRRTFKKVLIHFIIHTPRYHKKVLLHFIIHTPRYHRKVLLHFLLFAPGCAWWMFKKFIN